jgi:hypothetical protein
MLERLKYTLRFIFSIPKSKTEETISETKSFKVSYTWSNKYYSKKEKFILLMWSISMLAFGFEGMIYLILFWNSIIKMILVVPMIFFYMIYMKNISRIKEKYRKKALDKG